MALISTSTKEWEDQLTGLNRESKRIGLTMHKEKTKYMTNYDTDENIEIEGRTLERVSSYKYLGQTLKNGGHHKRRSYDESKSRMDELWKIQRHVDR